MRPGNMGEWKRVSGKETCVASAPESKGLARGGNSLENFACKYTGIVGNWIQDLGRAWSHLFSRDTKKKGEGERCQAEGVTGPEKRLWIAN